MKTREESNRKQNLLLKSQRRNDFRRISSTSRQRLRRHRTSRSLCRESSELAFDVWERKWRKSATKFDFLLFFSFGRATNFSFVSFREISLENFVRFLLSDENSIIDPSKFEVSTKMDRPLSNYFIASSHNSYLTGRISFLRSNRIWMKVLRSNRFQPTKSSDRRASKCTDRFCSPVVGASSSTFSIPKVRSFCRSSNTKSFRFDRFFFETRWPPSSIMHSKWRLTRWLFLSKIIAGFISSRRID